MLTLCAMIRPLALLGLCIALAGPAGAQQGGLRGAKPAAAAAPQTPPATAPPVTQPTTTPVQAADQCRAACARSYYFCLAGDSPEACPDAWSQCRLSCAPRASSSSLAP